MTPANLGAGSASRMRAATRGETMLPPHAGHHSASPNDRATMPEIPTSGDE